jgi:hypothetical protein
LLDLCYFEMPKGIWGLVGAVAGGIAGGAVGILGGPAGVVAGAVAGAALGGGTGVVLEIVSMHQVLYFDRNF